MLNMLLRVLDAATPTPTETTDPANTFYSPGTLGFIFVFGMAAASILLIFDMVRRIRRVRYRAEIQEKLEAESATKAPRSRAKRNK